MRIWIVIVALFLVGKAWAQEESLSLTLSQAIEIAQENSPEAEAARHTYRSAYWSYRFYKANYLPSVTLTSSPYFNKQISKSCKCLSKCFPDCPDPLLDHQCQFFYCLQLVYFLHVIKFSYSFSVFVYFCLLKSLSFFPSFC